MNANERLVEALDRGMRVNRDGVVISWTGRVLKPPTNSAGYLMVSAQWTDGSNAPIPVHRLVALQKFGASRLFAPGVEVRHRNGCRKDNTRGNILIGTHSVNMLDRKPEDRLAHARQAALARRSLSPREVRQLRADRARGMKYAELQAKYRLAKSTVSYIVNRQTYSMD